ncbi:MAG: hypothetical protein WCV00_08350 [Verrucomicrobiia bacterium]
MTERARKDLILCLLVAWTVAAVVVWQYRLGSARAWDDPVVYKEDSLFFAAVVKAARDGYYVPLLSKTNPQLGAPFIANWNDFPLTEDWLYCVCGLVARYVGLWRTLNLSLVVAAMLSAITLFWLARRIGVRRSAASIAAFLFALAPYLFYRSINHFHLVHYWHVPLLLFVVFSLGHRSRWRWRRKRLPFALIALLVGTLNVYYMYFFLLLLVLTALWRIAQSKSVREAVPAVAVGAIAATGFLISNVDTLVYACQHGRNPEAVARDPKNSELYALRPADLLIPPRRHRWWPLRRVGRAYQAESVILGERPSSYLGIVGVVSLVLLGALTFIELGRNRLGSATRSAGMVLWLVGACCVGGLNSLYGLGGFYLFRGANRVSIVILALTLLFGARLLSRWFRDRRAWTQWGIVGVLAVVGVWDQPSWRDGDETITEERRAIETDRAVGSFLQANLLSGAMVFQLPAMDCPESPWIGRVESYDLFRPYLHTEGLRFSFGNNKGRPDAQWQFPVAAMPFDQMLATLRTNRFQALYVDKRGYRPDEVAKMKQFLASAGLNRHFELGDFLVALLAGSDP